MNSDTQGFLIPDSRASMDAMTPALGGIKRDTALIVRLLKGQAKSVVLERARPVNPNSSVQLGRSQPGRNRSEGAGLPGGDARVRDPNSGRFTTGGAQPGAGLERAVRQITQQQAQQAASARRAEASQNNREGGDAAREQARDAQGRFGAGSNGGNDAKDKEGLFARLKESFSGRSGNADIDKIDPAIEATNELRDLIGGPLSIIGNVGKAVAARVGGEKKDKAVPWYRRMLTQLTMIRKDGGGGARRAGAAPSGVIPASSTSANSQDATISDPPRAPALSSAARAPAPALPDAALDPALALPSAARAPASAPAPALPDAARAQAQAPALPDAARAQAQAPALPSAARAPSRTPGAIGRAVIGRGFGGGMREKTVPWHRRTLTMLKLMRKDAGEYHRAELRALQGLRGGAGAGAGAGGDGGGLLGAAPSLLKNIVPGLLSALTKVAAPVAAIVSAVKSFGTSTDEYAQKLGTKDDGGLVKSVGIRTVGVLGDLGDTLTFGMAGKLGSAISPAVSSVVDSAKSGLEKLMPSYRGKANFDGIKGGASLAQNGRYTESEASTVRSLKASGANTSADLKGGMPNFVKEKIIAQAKAAGLDPDMMLKIAAMESGGNPNAISKTGAIGINQFTGATASGVGIKDRFNIDQNIAGGMKLTQGNIDILKAARLPVTTENVYMMHQLGPNAAKEIISGAANGKTISSLSPSTQNAVALNYGSGVKTAAEYIGKNSAALTSRAASVIGKPGAIASPSTASAGVIPALPTATVAPVLTAPTSMPSAAVSAPPLPAATPRSDIPVPINSKGPVEVTIKNDQLANQDMKDRRLAQIATGGMSGG